MGGILPDFARMFREARTDDEVKRTTNSALLKAIGFAVIITLIVNARTRVLEQLPLPPSTP